MSMKYRPNRLVLLFYSLAIFLNGCVANNFCHNSDQLKYVTWVSAIEIVEANKIRVTKETGAPVHFIDADGNEIESNILGLSDSIVLSDEIIGVRAQFPLILELIGISITAPDVILPPTSDLQGWRKCNRIVGTILAM